MNLLRKFLLTALLFCPLLVQANLSVQVSEPKLVGSKAIVKLTLKNNFAEKVESARAQVFLIDENGKVVGQATQWVIGGTKDKPPLQPGKETTFNFVISSEKPFTKTKLHFSRIILEGGKLADPAKNIEVVPSHN